MKFAAKNISIIKALGVRLKLCRQLNFLFPLALWASEFLLESSRCQLFKREDCSSLLLPVFQGSSSFCRRCSSTIPGGNCLWIWATRLPCNNGNRCSSSNVFNAFEKRRLLEVLVEARSRQSYMIHIVVRIRASSYVLLSTVHQTLQNS